MDSISSVDSSVVDDNGAFFEYDIPMVSSDGESHALLTMVAICSGLVGAIIVLLILIVLIDYHRYHPHQTAAKTKTKSSVFHLFGKRQSLDITDPVFVLTAPGSYPHPAASSSKSSVNGMQVGYVNERFRFDETVFASNGKLAGISTVSC